MGQPGDANHPARVHATLDLLGRHMAAMQQSLAPKLAAGRGAPPKKVKPGALMLSCPAAACCDLFATGVSCDCVNGSPVSTAAARPWNSLSEAKQAK